MKRRISNYGPDVFFRRLRMTFRYGFICFWSSLVISILTFSTYVSWVLPEGSWGLIPKYIHHQFIWSFKGNAPSKEFLLQIEQFFYSHYPNFFQGFLLALFAGLISGSVLAYIFWKVGKRNQENSHLRGAEIITPKQLEKEQKKVSRFGFSNGYDLGKLAPKIWEEFVWRGMAIIGRPGTGKSNLIRQMLAQDLNRNTKCFIIDINGDYYRKFGRPGKDKILSLRHKDSVYWDFKCEDVVPSLMASYLVPKTSTGQAFWWKAGRGVLSFLLERSEDLDDFKNQLAQTDGEILGLLKENEELVSKVLGKAGSAQSAGVLGNTVLDFGFLRDLGYWPRKMGKQEPFSIVDWASNTDDDSWVYVVFRDDELEEIKPLLGCWFNLAINGCFRRDEAKVSAGEYPSIRFVIDELKSMGKLEELEKAGERLRKYRGSLVLGYQNNAQIEAIYGKQGAQNLKDVLQIKVIYSAGDTSVQEELSKLLGEQEIEETNANISYGKKDSDIHSESHRITNRRIVLPSEIGKLSDGECYLKIGSFDPAKCHIGYQEFPDVNPRPSWGVPPRLPSPTVTPITPEYQPADLQTESERTEPEGASDVSVNLAHIKKEISKASPEMEI